MTIRRFIGAIVLVTASCTVQDRDSLTGTWVGRNASLNPSAVRLTLLDNSGQITGHLGSAQPVQDQNADVITFNGIRAGNQLSLLVEEDGKQQQLVARIHGDSITMGSDNDRIVFVREVQ